MAAASATALQGKSKGGQYGTVYKALTFSCNMHMCVCVLRGWFVQHQGAFAFPRFTWVV